MKVLILAGGYGTRLQPLTMRVPKCMLPIADSNTIIKIIDSLKGMQIDEIIISLNKSQYKVKEYLDTRKLVYRLTYDFEEALGDADKPGAVGALLNITKKFGADDYLVLGADNYFRGLDLKELAKHHESSKADVTIAHYKLDDISKVSSFGVGVINEKGRIIEFQEKPSVEKALSNFVSTFLYYMSRKFIEKYLPEYVDKQLKMKKKPDNMGDLWEYYCKKLNLYAYTFKGCWFDVGRPATYIEANRAALEELSHTVEKGVKISRSAKIRGKVLIRSGSEIKEDVIIIGPCVIDNNVKIERGSIIGPYTIILHDSNIGAYNIINSSILFERTTTQNDVKINRAIIDGKTTLLKNTKIEEHAIIGYSCRIGENSQILYDSKLWPFLNVEKDSVINSKINYECSAHSEELNNSKYWE